VFSFLVAVAVRAGQPEPMACRRVRGDGPRQRGLVPQHRDIGQAAPAQPGGATGLAGPGGTSVRTRSYKAQLARGGWQRWQD
jgi:hypothetical protein